jgi:hypothetical protein
MKAHHCKWLLVFFMLWLPLQGAAAAILSVCAQEKSFTAAHDKSAIAIDNHHHDGCHKQTEESTSEHAGHVLASLPCDDTSCDAYSHTPMLPGTVASIPITDTSTIASFDSGFVSFVPEHPQRPPVVISL